MQIFDLIACVIAAGTANGCHMMGYSHAEKDLKRNGRLNLNLE